MSRARITAGADMFTTAPIAGRRLRFSDGTQGVGGLPFDERDVALCTPCGTALAASWDAALVEEVGRVVGAEACRRGVDAILAPVLNLPRSPLGGRVFECLGEDPLLAGRLAAAWIAGVQSQGVAATPKHFVCNDAETSRRTVDCVVGERALREIYLAPFEHALRAGAWALMAAYNRVNGTYCAAHGGLLRDVVKGEWGWDGVVVSDWYGAHDTVACARGGLDLEMPGPSRAFGAALAEAVAAGDVPEAVLDEQVERLERLARRVGHASAPAPEDPRALLREAAAAGCVLLRNEGGLLPLPPGARIAVIGAPAAEPCLQGGGTSWVSIRQVRDPLSALAARLDVTYERGCAVRSRPAPLRAVATVEYLRGDAVVAREERRAGTLVWLAELPGGADRVRLRAVLEPPVAGLHAFAVRGSGPVLLRVDGFGVARLDPPAGVPPLFSDLEARAEVELGGPAVIEAELAVAPGRLHLLGLGCAPPEPPDGIDRAVAAAAAADAAVLFVGTTESEESESVDRATTALPGAQEELGRRVLATNPRTVVVVNAGAPVDLAWARPAAAILYAWLGGEELAEALAEVLTGAREPGGRLPLTLARANADWPAWSTVPDARGRLEYRESVHVGYRHFDAHGLEPEFCFGHGLGYTEFAYEDLQLAELTALVTVRNAGARAGKEVVQAYVDGKLAAFAAVTLAPGEARTVALELDERAFSRWEGGWRVLPGEHELSVGRSSRDVRLRGRVRAG